MDEIGVFTPEQARAIWHDYLSRQARPGSNRNSGSHPQQDKCVILDAALAVASDSKTGATSGLATVCYWSIADEEYTESSPLQQITVYNHSESTGHDEDTFGVARWINGHWWFFGDCSAMASR